MKTTVNDTGAATPVKKDRFDRKNVNTRVSPVINFQIGIIAALILAFLIIELTSANVTKKVNATKARTFDLEPEQDHTVYRIVANHPKKVQTAQPEQKVEIIPDNTPEVTPDPEPVPDPNPTDTPVDSSKLPITTDKATTSDTKEKPSSTVKTPLTTTMLGLHEMPLFPGCKERYDNMERKECFNERIRRFVIKNFNTNLANELGLAHGSKVKIQIAFTIDTNGIAKDIQVRAPHKELQNEAYRVINKLPTIVPGKVSGDAVNMKFALPLVFSVQD